jgi:hypothetical protein
VWWRRSCAVYRLHHAPEGMEAPPGDLPPRPVRGRLWQKACRGTIVVMDQAMAQGEI